MTRELDERGKNHRIQAYVIPSTEKKRYYRQHKLMVLDNEYILTVGDT